jgi:hypothetical protein
LVTKFYALYFRRRKGECFGTQRLMPLFKK